MSKILFTRNFSCKISFKNLICSRFHKFSLKDAVLAPKNLVYSIEKICRLEFFGCFLKLDLFSDFRAMCAQWYKIRKKVQNYQMLIAKDPKTNNFHHKILGFLSLFAKQSSFWISQNPSSKFLIQNSILDFWSSSQEFILVYFMQMNQNTPIIY